MPPVPTAPAITLRGSPIAEEAGHGQGDGGDQPHPHPLLRQWAARRGAGAADPRQPHHRPVLAGRGRRLPRRPPAGRARPALLWPDRAQAGRRHPGPAGLERRPARAGRGPRLGRQRAGPRRRLVQRRRGGGAVRHRPRRRAGQHHPGRTAGPLRVRRQQGRARDALLGRLGRDGRGHGRPRLRAPGRRRGQVRGRPGLQPPGGDADLLLVAGLQGPGRGRADRRGAPHRCRRHRLPRRSDHLAELARGGARPLRGQQRLLRQVVRHQRLRRPPRQAARAVAARRPGPGDLGRVDVRLRHPGQAGGGPRLAGHGRVPAQPQVGQTRALLDRYAAGGGSVREVVLEGCGHGPRSSARPRSASASWPISRAQPKPLPAAHGIRSTTP